VVLSIFAVVIAALSLAVAPGAAMSGRIDPQRRPCGALAAGRFLDKSTGVLYIPAIARTESAHKLGFHRLAAMGPV
jgi:hypothetical protein